MLQKFIREELPPAELQTFLALARDPDNQAALKEAIGHLLDADTFTDLSAGVVIDQQFVAVMKKAKSRIPITQSDDLHQIGASQLPPVHRIRPLYRRWWAAASVILLLAAGVYFLTRNKPQVQPVASHQQIDIGPGRQGAILTLADGTPLVLDSLGNGVVATQNGTRVVLKNGQLAYDATGKTPGSTSGEITYNTMTTPKGRQFQLTLPDGTKVWLNAASSIHFPTMFAGYQRQVQVTGEAYFEVAGDAKRPFRVSVGKGAEIEVLGTNFNINAYDNEPDIKTTLLEGKVKVVNSNSHHPGAILTPGQQAVIRSDDPLSAPIPFQTADLDK
ncbi:MAG: FecR domain-containing protein, partial [Chitinophaga rupis]